MSRSSDAKTAGLRAWADGITRRRGKKVAMVALARRLARILFAMWRDETEYQAETRSSDQWHRTGDRGPHGRCQVTGEVVKLEEQARVGIWPLLRAVPQRALLLLRTLLCAGALSATQERE